MRLAFLGPFGLHPKGTMRARALPLARALAGRGHRVTVIMPPWHRPQEAGRAWPDDVEGVDLVNVSLAGLGVPGLGHGVVAARMARGALALLPDVVHVFKPKAYGGLAGAMLAGRRKLGRAAPRLVVDTDDWEGPGGWNDLEPYPAWQKRFFAWQERAGLTRHAQAVTVASRALEAMALGLGVARESLLYLPNAIDDSPAGAPLPDSWRPSEGAAPELLLYTRFFEFGPSFALDVLARVREDHPGARLVVAGTGLFGEEARLAEDARSRGLAEAVELRGWVEPDELAALMARAQVALYPFDDTLINRTKSSVKLLELLAAGPPVVASSVGQNAEVIAHGEGGLLVPPGDAPAFAAAVGELLADAGLRERLARGARERIHSELRWSLQAPRVEALYRRLLGREGA